MSRAVRSLLAPSLVALALATPAPAAIVSFTGEVEITVGGNLVFLGTGGGTAIVNDGHPISVLAISRTGPFASAAGTTVSIGVAVGHPTAFGSTSSALGVLGNVGVNLSIPLYLGAYPIVSIIASTNPGSTFATDRLALAAPFSVQGGPLQGTPGIIIIRVHLIPEPATFALLGVGIVGLVAYGQRRVR